MLQVWRYGVVRQQQQQADFCRDGLQIQISCQSEEFTGDQGLVLVGEGKGQAQRNGSVRQAQQKIQGLNRQNETMN